MRHSLKVLGAVAGISLLFAGCGSSSGNQPESAATPTQTTSTTPSAAPAGSLLVWADDTRAKLLTQVAAKFKADKGVNVTVVQKDFGKIRDDLISQGPSGKGPDVIVGAHDWLGKLVQNGAVAPIELGDKASEFSKTALDAVTYDGKVYGLPYAVENVAFIRNTTLAPNKPKDFADAIKTGEALVKAKKATLPIAIQQDAKVGDPYHLYPLQTSFGSVVFGTNASGTYDPTKLELGNAQGVAFAKALAQLGKDGVLKASVSFDIAKKMFIDGKTPYTITGPWNTGDFAKAGIKFSVEDIPSLGGKPSQPFIGVQAFFISQYSKNQLLANDFVVNYLGTPEVAKQLYDAGQRPPAMTSVFDQVKSDPVIAGFGTVGQNCVPLPNIPAMDAVWAEWGSTELAIIQGKGGDPAKLWTAMASKIAAQIKG